MVFTIPLAPGSGVGMARVSSPVVMRWKVQLTHSKVTQEWGRVWCLDRKSNLLGANWLQGKLCWGAGIQPGGLDRDNNVCPGFDVELQVLFYTSQAPVEIRGRCCVGKLSIKADVLSCPHQGHFHRAVQFSSWEVPHSRLSVDRHCTSLTSSVCDGFQ